MLLGAKSSRNVDGAGRSAGRRVWSALAVMAVGSQILLACTRSAPLTNTSDYSVAPDSPEITMAAYRDKRVLIAVPAGNRQAVQPEFPESTKARFSTDLRVREAEVQARYVKAMNMLRRDPSILQEIRRAALLHGLDPIHVVSAIIGEHTYNVSGQDAVQTYAILATRFAASWALRFRASGIGLDELIKGERFATCRANGPQAEYWDCIGWIWERDYRGKTVDGRTFPNSSLRMTFFNPVASGLSYGLGQLDPLRALMVADRVHELSGLRRLDVSRPVEIYEDIIEPTTTVHYIAANLKLAIDTYINEANFDISANPGLTATLYNLGREKGRARELYRRNLETLRRGQGVILPEENYYGWFINQKQAEIRTLVP
ncbi:MAG TPA: DUF1402 family protein [Pseudobdellovibrionaceae bacterium]|nr:DUF1402 family protein [Pseudobdellovibrionaceae bacterium]